jgi:para-nitrobenzyl esterase
VTIAGESAGGMSVGTLLGAPAAKGLFRRAIPQSGASHHSISEASAARIAALLTELLGVDPADVTDEQLLAAQQTLSNEITATRDPARFGEEAASSTMGWLPMAGGDVLPQRAIDAVAGGLAKDVDVLIGTCREEFMLFLGIAPEIMGLDESMTAPMFDMVFGTAGRDALATYQRNRTGAPPVELIGALETDRMFRIPGIRLAEAQVANGATTFAYLFSWQSPAFGGRIKAGHALELPFTWDNVGDVMARRLIGDDPPQALADDMHGAWVRFISDGDPGWPAYDVATRTTRDFGGASRIVDDPLGDERVLWEGIL